MTRYGYYDRIAFAPLEAVQRWDAAELGLAQQRYVKSHRIFANSLGVKDFRPIRNSHDGTCFSRSVLGA